MIPIFTAFISLLVLFALMGSLRGWAREIIVTFSAVLALFVEQVLLTFVPPIRDMFNHLAPEVQFYICVGVFIVITIFGYIGPTIAASFGAKVAREQLQDMLLGFFIGLLNGYLIVGTLFSFLDAANYGVPVDMVLQQQKVDESGQPVLDKDGKPEMEVVGFLPEATGIGGIVPPAPDSAATKMMAFMLPELVEKSDAILYIAVAAAFVFVIVVFI